MPSEGRHLRQLLRENAQLRARLKELEALLKAGKPAPEDGEWLRPVVATMAEGVVVQNAQGEIEECNASAERILGLSRDQMRGRTSHDPKWRAIHEDGSPFPGETHPAMVTLRTGEPCSQVIVGVHKPDGQLTWISINSEPVFHEGETIPYAVVTSFSDISQLKQAEQERTKLHEKLQTALTKVLSGYLPICAKCKKIREKGRHWVDVERFLSTRTEAALTHSLCPDCLEYYQKEIDQY